MTAFEIVNTVLNGVIALAAVLAAAVATAGLYTWRKQLRGQSEFAAATRLLRCAYRVKGAFQAVRAMIGMNKPDELMPKLQQALSEFSEAMADMDVLSPGLAKPAADAFRDCVHEYGNAVRRQKRMDSRKAEVSQEEYEQIDSVLWADPEDDALGRKLDDAMQTFEKLLRPIVGGRTTHPGDKNRGRN